MDLPPSLQKSLLTGKAIEFSVAATDVLRGPGVYLYVRNDKAEYVGCGHNMLGRALARNHHIMRQIFDGCSLILLPCKSMKEARQLEDQLIFDLNPQFNNRGGWKQLAKTLGLASHSAAKMQYVSKLPQNRNVPRETISS